MAKQQCLPYYRITFSQTYHIVGQVGTFEMAEHSPFKSQIRELFLPSTSAHSVPKPQLHFSALLGRAAHPLMHSVNSAQNVSGP